MSIHIKEVKTKNDLKKWVEFPNKLYKDTPEFVPFLTVDEMDTFSKEKNPAYDYCETKLLLAYKDGEIAGRIAGLINNAANEKWNTENIRFTRFDFVDDFAVSKSLFDEIVKWGKEKGLSKIVGPIGFHDLDHEGMLVEGFNEVNLSITFYNHPYYVEHMAKLGLDKEVDWVEYQLKVPTEVNPKLTKISQFLQKRYGYKLIEYQDRKTLMQDAYEAFKVIDVSFSNLYGTVPLTDKVINKLIKDYVPIINLKYLCSVKDKENKIIGFAILVPSIAKALKKSNGKLFPFGMFRLLKALKGKNDILEMYFIGISPEFQKQGVPAMIMEHILKVCIENSVKICETGPELELNESVQSLWDGFDVRRHKRRRCFQKSI